MGSYVFRLPDVGEGIAQAEIVAWHVEVGDTVAEDQPLVDVMTDKATVEISSPVSGRVTSRNGEAGKVAAVGEELVVIETASEAREARKAADASQVPSQPSEKARPRAEPRRDGKVQAAPAVRARAAALRLDLAAVPGSGPEGRIEHADLDRLLQSRLVPREAPVSLPDAGNVEEVKVIGLRRQIAERMQDSKRRIPHFAYVEEVDVTALEALRADLNSAGDAKPRLTLLPFLIRAIARSVASHPGLNAHFDDEAGVIRRHKDVHAGIATQTPRGLVVPVVRHAQARDLWGIASEIAGLSEAARAGKATREELSGSTITVSSLGALGGIMATPIINPPEVAIIGVNRIVERPVVRDGRITIARVMNLSSSFDHRVVDGFDAAAFIKDVKAELEAPGRLLSR
jgi:2-oxoisovalerate dehydrogenase E2 component (dihydrolipoyl transacylase)